MNTDLEVRLLALELVASIGLWYKMLPELSAREIGQNPGLAIALVAGASLGFLACTKTLTERDLNSDPDLVPFVTLSHYEVTLIRALLLIPLCMLILVGVNKTGCHLADRCRNMHFTWQGYTTMPQEPDVDVESGIAMQNLRSSPT